MTLRSLDAAARTVTLAALPLAVARGGEDVTTPANDGLAVVSVQPLAQALGNNVTLFLNDGTGQMGRPATFEAGVSGEWGLAAADFTGDGRLDLVVGVQDHQVRVLRSEGDGRFTPMAPVDAGGETWMVTTGDVDGDGRADVATANSSTNSGAVLLGDGRGGLRRAGTYGVGPFTLATDLADLDGDGDLALVDEDADEVRLLRNRGPR